MISHLALQVRLVLLEVGADGCKTHFFTVELDLEIVSSGELIGHLVLHLSDLLCDLLHFLVDTTLECLDFLEIVLSLFKLDLESSICVLSILDLTLLEGKLIFLVLKLGRGRQIILANHSLLHMLQQSCYGLLMLSNLSLISGLFIFEVLHELIYLALLLVQNFVLLGLVPIALAA